MKKLQLNKNTMTKTLTIKSNIQTGRVPQIPGSGSNHNQTMTKLQLKKNTTKTFTMKTKVKAGVPGSGENHNQSLKINAAKSLKVKAEIRAGVLSANHNQSLKTKTNLKAGRLSMNHNQNVTRLQLNKTTISKVLTIKSNIQTGRVPPGSYGNHNQSLQIKTKLKAGGIQVNHNQKLQLTKTTISKTLTIKSNVQTGRVLLPPGSGTNHNQNMTKLQLNKNTTKTLKTSIKAGVRQAPGSGANHNQTVKTNKTLKVKANVRAGALNDNHNQDVR